jgi:hypothetical protein
LEFKTYRDIEESLLSKVQPTNLRGYIRSNGWVRITTDSAAFTDIAIFRKNDDEILVPQKIDFGDYARRIGDIVETLSAIEKRPKVQILNDVLIPSSDILRFKVSGPTSGDGTVPLGEGLGLIAGSKKALLAAAHQVLQPQRFHPRLKRAEADEFMNSCRLGQTERGSFIATFICPVTAQIEFDDPATPNEPFSRKVTEGLIRGVSAMLSAIDQDNLDPIKNQKDGSAFVSANLCDAIVEMQPMSLSNLTITGSWAPTIPAPTNIISQLEIRRDYIPAIEQIAKDLRPQVAPKEDLFIGKIDSLHGSVGENGKVQGDVVLAFVHDDGELLRAKLNLNADAYATACDAHKLGKYVEVSGTLHRGHRANWIKDPKSFTYTKK